MLWMPSPDRDLGRRARCAAGCMLAGLILHQPPARAIDLLPRAVTASLWTESDGIVAGQPFALGLLLSHAPGWHSYWRVPGDSGLPTRLSWRLPGGFSAGELQWPAPRRLPIGPLVDYGYEGDTLLVSELRAPPGLLPGSEVRLEAHA